jgi:ankyrin repeat protein
MNYSDLCEAIRRGEGEEYLKENRVDVNARDNYQHTPLYLATLNRHIDVVQFLIEKGADVNARDNSHNTPLHCGLLVMGI